MRTTRLYLGLLIMLGVLAGVHAPIAHAQEDLPHFEEISCSLGVAVDVRCGYLTVLEDRSTPDGPTIRLLVAIFKSTSSDPAPDPVIYLNGGPGGSSITHAPYFIEAYFMPFLAHRDVILFDQRGTGYANPALDCPEFTEMMLDSLEEDIGAAEYTMLNNESIMACHDRLHDAGIDLSAYTSAANAADLEDLRQVLGYDEWNLYGISYGTRLALTTMRDHPEGIRSVILDSTYPPQADLYAELTTNADRAFNVLFEGCAADPDCNAAYPNLEAIFYETVERLNETPVIVTVRFTVTGEVYEMVVNGNVLIDLLFENLYRTTMLPVLPRMIYTAHAGYYDALSPFIEQHLLQSEYINEGMYYAIQCGEEAPFSRGTAAEIDTSDIPAPLETYFGTWNEGTYALCETWDARRADPVENEAVVSDIPTLVLAGEYDPVTPPAWGALAAETLSNGYFYEVPGYGHGVTRGGDCPRDIAIDFLNNPGAAPDVTCLDTMGAPDFMR